MQILTVSKTTTLGVKTTKNGAKTTKIAKTAENDAKTAKLQNLGFLPCSGIHFPLHVQNLKKN